MFDHHYGTDETVWARHPRLGTGPRLAVPDRGDRLVVVAHPDDESLGSGALIAGAARGALIDVDHSRPAGAVHDSLGVGRHRILQHIEDDFLLDVWSTTGQSVALRTRIVA